MVDSENLVVGDLVAIDAGDAISADMRLVESSSLKAEEASLTGESVPVEKDASLVCDEGFRCWRPARNMLYGNCRDIRQSKRHYYSYGRQTELGQIANKLTSIKNEQTPLRRILMRLARYLPLFVLLYACIIVLIVDIFVQKEEWTDALMTAVSLAVAAIPEGLCGCCHHSSFCRYDTDGREQRYRKSVFSRSRHWDVSTLYVQTRQVR